MEKLRIKDETYGYDIPPFLYAYLFKFLLRNQDKVKLEGQVLVIEDIQTASFLRAYLEEVLEELLEEFYEPPNQKKISKYSGRYVRIKTMNQKYVLDYTTSLLGRISYQIFAFKDWIDKTISG